HAPFHVDSLNRLLESEIDRYFSEIERARTAYRGQITILRGLETGLHARSNRIDTERMLARYDLDFAIGSIHYIPMAYGDQIKVWDLARLNDPAVLGSVFFHTGRITGMRPVRRGGSRRHTTAGSA
ncbi:MAG: hypothetical protein IPJ18_20490, partial [Betaproteobacteria bacterium]|nr:hypothetical protein [Betaproteobacteria bacterium]